VADFASGLAQLAQRPDVLLVDLQLPDGNGIDLIEWTKQTDPRIVILAVTAFGNIEIAVRAVKQGAYDFLTKPVEPAVLGVALDRAVEACSLRGEVEALRGALATENAMRGIIGKSAALHDILSLVRRVADSQATVLITGPSGSGKERVARALHEASKRGLLDGDALGMIEGVLDVADLRVRDIMIPRAQMIFVRRNDPVASKVSGIMFAEHGDQGAQWISSN